VKYVVIIIILLSYVKLSIKHLCISVYKKIKPDVRSFFHTPGCITKFEKTCTGRPVYVFTYNDIDNYYQCHYKWQLYFCQCI